MLATFQKELLLSSLMFVFLVCSILGKIMLGVLYQNMIEETENTVQIKICELLPLKPRRGKRADFCGQVPKPDENRAGFREYLLSSVRTDHASVGALRRNCGLPQHHEKRRSVCRSSLLYCQFSGIVSAFCRIGGHGHPGQAPGVEN